MAFEKILIANRGEIAVRVIRTARKLGFKTVAVYSSADARAIHVRQADQSVCIGQPLPSQSYLRIDAILAAAQATGADAVHPGYGFLAESEAFARACRDSGLVFIGPSAEAIGAMGNKAGAKQRMQKAGIPCLSGFEGSQDEERLVLEADRIGYPVMIKAVAGGGGRGMRLVSAATDFRAALRSAKSEALSAFGNGDVLIETAVTNPRHIEIQVFGDRHGNAIHLGERDCSVQRRHQKIVEEAPSPAMTPALRSTMGAAAVKAVLAIGYEGAGTLEFLLDGDGRWYFMEMNTRLQVEHPVTEAITGLDLVELQLRVASGEPLPVTQEEILFDGHAIEVRLCAEDPQRDFLPQSGTMGLWQLSDRVRVEQALESGMEIPPYYDSMIAKLIAHATTRDDARRRLAAALDQSVALGVITNRSFLASCLRHPVFAEGRATTGFIAAHADELRAIDRDDMIRVLAIAALLLFATQEGGSVTSSLAPTHSMPRRIHAAERTHDVLLDRVSSGQFRVSLHERSFNLALVDMEANLARVECDGVAESVPWLRQADTLHIQFRSQSHSLEDRTLAAAATAGIVRDGKIRASINGRIIAIHAAIGDTLTAGQPVFTLEAMKMEHTHGAPIAGTLCTFNASLNDQVSAARVIAEIEPSKVASS